MRPKRLRKLLIANRGEIACRVMRTAKEMGIGTVGVFTEHDADMPHAQGEGFPISSYLAADEIIHAAISAGAQAIHPGYGFLAENPEFVRACEKAGLIFIGPSAEAMEAVGDKSSARETARGLGIPVIEGLGPFTEPKQIEAAARKMGPPLMLKAAAGGGGKGMKRVPSLEGLSELIATAQRETGAAFGDGRMIVERYVRPARHVEVQIFADGKRAIALGERECSLQRRHQKIIEESPSQVVDESLRACLYSAAVNLAEAVGYRSAGTVEFLLGPNGDYHFLEVNARLQVEHPVTEMRTGLDLVRMQIEAANGEPLMKQEDVKSAGHAIEARLCAEDPWNGFLPSAGKLLKVSWPTLTHYKIPGARVRVDTGMGRRVAAEYDSLLAKIICWAPGREAAREGLIGALQQTVLLGLRTNQSFLMQLLESEVFAAGQTFVDTVDEWAMGQRPLPAPLLLAAAAALRGPVEGGLQPWTGLGSWRLT